MRDWENSLSVFLASYSLYLLRDAFRSRNLKLWILARGNNATTERLCHMELTKNGSSGYSPYVTVRRNDPGRLGMLEENYFTLPMGMEC